MVGTLEHVLSCQVVDDESRTRLSSVLSELRPVEIVKPKGALSQATERALRDGTRFPLVNELDSETRFWDPATTSQKLERYFGDDETSNSWPLLLKHIIDAKDSDSVALSAFGGCISYLEELLLDKDLLCMKRVEVLPGTDTQFPELEGYDETLARDDSVWETNIDNEPTMVLDSAALENLEILENSIDGSEKG